MSALMTFWLITGGISVLVTALLLRAFLRGHDALPDAADSDIAVYRDQLSEIDRDLARGVIDAEAAERSRVEVSRRILAADRQRSETSGGARVPRGLTYAMAALVALGVVGGSFALYMRLGAPGYGDLPLQARLDASAALRDDRPGQAAAEAQAARRLPQLPEPDPEYVALVERLRATVAERGDDADGLRLLARNEAALGNFTAAHQAQARLIGLLGDAADARTHADHADLLILAAGGYVSPEAQRAIEAALARDPANGTARYYTGLLHAQTGRPDLAFSIWRELLLTSTPDAPWIPPIRAQIEDAAARAGIRFALPEAQPAAPGPSADDIAAAEALSAEERMEMIRGMVSVLSDRLATEGGPPEDWARLIGALGVLGDRSQAAAIYTESQEVFAGNDPALGLLEVAARQAGLVQ